MSQQGRSKGGQFTSKSDEPRQVRSLRVTDAVWEKLGEVASERGMTRADLIEEWTEQKAEPPSVPIDQAIFILTQALRFRANAGGAIKAQIRRAIELLKPSNTRPN